MSVEVRETTAAPVAPVGRPKRFSLIPRSGREWLVRFGSVVAVLTAWQLYAPHLNPIFLRPPSDVATVSYTHLTLPTICSV